MNKLLFCHICMKLNSICREIIRGKEIMKEDNYLNSHFYKNNHYIHLPFKNNMLVFSFTKVITGCL